MAVSKRKKKIAKKNKEAEKKILLITAGIAVLAILLLYWMFTSFS